ncbi:hypothetical protein GCM10008986_14470 [Salinibacillus aidingensis]|uniref:Uncharacterized protein n=1 Tax=Salinibacillus aidingensis TaxID=237684 RepID=A0ABP3L325_9BACI
MLSKRHLLFNLAIIIFPWLSLLLLGKRNVKRFSIAGIVIVIIEFINHKTGQKRQWWAFYDKKKSFITNELPFSIGPYMPIAMWILRFSYGDFKKFLLTNAVSDGIFAFVLMDLLRKIKIVRLNRLNHVQFFFYLYYKAFILYGVQYWVENRRRKEENS